MIEENVKRYLAMLPPNVRLLAATKRRSAEEVRRAIKAGVQLIGENYVQEAAQKFNEIGRIAEWHLIGHLQRNKAKLACGIFDVIETIDSVKIAETLNRRCKDSGRVMKVMIEVNSGREENKSGIMPEHAVELADAIYELENLQLIGVMTMGPAVQGENIRPYFRLTRQIFSELKERYKTVEFLSMGMTSSWKIAVEEGANIVRIGSGIFGPRD